MASAHEHFSEQFQKWEMRGRGWQVFPEPVCPEPPFVPLRFSPMTEPPMVDDGRGPTFLSSLFKKLARPVPPPLPIEPEEEPDPISLVRGPLVELRASLPEKLALSPKQMQHLFGTLALCSEPLSFELLGVHRRTLAQFAAATEDASLVRKQLAAHFPEVQFSERRDTLTNAWQGSKGEEAFAVEFGLERELMLPLAACQVDPFVGVVAAMSELRPGELALYQVLWQPVRNPWAEGLLDSVTLSDGKPMFVDAPELADAATAKAAKPLYAAVVRIMVRAASRLRLFEIARDLATAMRVFSSPEGNALIPMGNDGYPYLPHLEDVLRRRSRRVGMVLDEDELAGFVHLPEDEVRSPTLMRDAGLTKAAPAAVQAPPGVVIGDNEHNGDVVAVFLNADQRFRHTYIIGSSGTGKSSLLLNLIRQDIENGDGVGVLDPHGDLVKHILGMVPDNRVGDVVLVDPSDVDYPVAFNILSAHSDDEKALLASDLIAVFRRLATSWGDQMDMVLQNAILAFLESKRGGTLADLRLFLLDGKYRKQFLDTVNDPEIVFYWKSVFPQLTGGKSIGPVLTRLQDFFSRKPLRNMVGQERNKLDFADIMDSGKIFLARLPEGCGEENSYLLGTLLVSKFQQLAMARYNQAEAQRRRFWLYIDEFAHFITPTMAKILSGVRKCRLGLTLAHQNLYQLEDDPKVASAVLTQPCTRIIFKVGDDDARKLGDGFESFDAKSLKNLPKYHAIARVEQNDWDFNLAVRKPELPDARTAEKQREKAIATSRRKYATPREEVEASLRNRIWGHGKPPEEASETPSPEPIKSLRVHQGPAETRRAPAKQTEKTEAPPATDSEKKSTATAPQPAPAPIAAQEPTLEPAPIASEAKQPKEAGRGLAWHKSVQKRLKTEAQSKGFQADAEKQLAKGSMQAADLVLRRGHTDIAVEIASSASNVNHEFENVQKCLNAGFSRVAAVAAGRKFLESLAAAVRGALGPEAAAKVGYYTPDEFIDELAKLAGASEQAPEAGTMVSSDKRHGIEIERTFPKLTAEEQQATQKGIHEIVTKAMSTPRTRKHP